MDKMKSKARKKNVETGLLMGQNTNVFSQLSASLLQNRENNTEEEQRFLQNTPVVEYHDPEVNRVLALLRKKADVTKGKAATQLREIVSKMTPQQVEEFISTFAQLYLETVINEPNKAIIEEFAGIASDLITNHKKAIISEISTLYPPLLLTHRPSKLAPLLFNGPEQQLPKKTLLLLLKKDVSKKFMLMLRLVLDSEALHKIPQPQMQRNCQSLTKLLREILRISVLELEAEKGRFFKEVCDSMGKQCIDEYFRVGGKAQASILQLYASLIAAAAKKPEWGLPWQLYAKTIGQCFLNKDVLVQQALWRGAIHSWLEGLLEIQGVQGKEEERGKILDIYLPKSEEKVLSCLGVGGFALYKQLPRFCELFPWTVVNNHDSHKQLINKLGFFKKLMTSLLGQEDQNQARMECYSSLARLLVGRVRALQINGEEKKMKQLRSLAGKFEREIIMSLQDCYYSTPPTSKNSFSFYIPQHFGQLLNDLQPDFDVKFNSELSYQLYHKLLPSAYAQRIQDELFEHSKTSQLLTLNYLETFPPREVKVDMSEENGEVQTAAKIFLLASKIPKEGEDWMNLEWDVRKQLIAFDPRITQRDLEVEDEEEDHLYSLYFRPSHRNLHPRYQCAELDPFRFNYFKEILLDPELSHYIKYLLPYLSDVLLPRNPQLADEMFSLFASKCKLAQTGNWAVSSHEVLIVRVMAQVLCDVLLKERGFSNFKKEPLETCLSALAEFVRLLSVYKMERQSEDVLRRLQGLLGVVDARNCVLISCSEALKKTWSQLLKGTEQGTEKVRRNRVKNCLEFSHRLLGVVAHSDLPQQLATSFLLEETNWREGHKRSEPWHIFQAILDSLAETSRHEVLKGLILSQQQQLQLVLLLSSEILLPLQAVPKLRRFFIDLKSFLQKQLVAMTVQDLTKLLGKIAQRVLNQSTFELAEGLRGTIIFVLLEREEQTEELLKGLKQEILIKPFQQLLKGNSTLLRTLIFNTIISSIPLRKIPEAEKIGADLISTALTTQGERFLMLVSTLSLFWSKGVGSAEAAAEEGKLVVEVMHGVLKATPQTETALLFNFYHYVLFGLANTAVSLAGWPILIQFLQKIDLVFWEEGKKGQLEGLALSQKMKFASRAVLSREGPALARLITELPEVISKQLDSYSGVLQLLEGEQQILIQDSLVTLFIESAEFMLRATAFINNKQVANQHTLLKLVQCSFPAIRKAAFLMLKSMYQGKLVPRSLPEEFKANLSVTLKGELEGDLDKEAISYFYSWQLVLFRRQATERAPQSEEELPLSLEQALQPNGLSELLLRNCFWVIEDRLDYLKREGDFTVFPEDLLNWDPETDFLVENEPQKRIFLLTLRTFFLFVSSFPVNLRDLVDRFKRYRPVCQRLLRNVVTQTIFREEVAQIELLEAEWKQGGNLQIYVTSHNRQIYAEYCHEAIRIGLRLLVKSTYPLAPILLQFGEGLKMEEGSRWGLMLQSQLKSRNSSIIRGILLWKQNVDRRLGGVEECAICFDIVNTYGQLPKKGCKTCKKKFHGNCIMKWFSKSNKSECPLCKSQFL